MKFYWCSTYKEKSENYIFSDKPLHYVDFSKEKLCLQLWFKNVVFSFCAFLELWLQSKDACFLVLMV